ncbi:MAG TPA: MFS transporter [Clostridia bacterium]|nr:MFS transporter [Clostridia bacterium]
MERRISFFAAARALKGNQRACVIAEPFWAIPYYLFLPFASMYMAAIGLRDEQIGFLASLGPALQFVWGLLSGAIIEKYGRRRTMLIFSLLSWTVPCALWAGAQSYLFFVIGAVFNSMWRVTGNCFSCIIVEDSDDRLLVHAYTILGVIGLVAGFLSPLAGQLIKRFSLVPAMRVLYLVAMVSITVKAFTLYRLSRESTAGRLAMEQSKRQNFLALALGGWPAFRAAMRQKRALLCVVFMTLMSGYNIVQATFWPLYVTDAYGMSDALYSVLPFIKSAVMLLLYLFVTPRIRITSVRRPLFWALGVQTLGLAALLYGAKGAGSLLFAAFLSAACEGFALSLLGPLSETLLATNIPNEQRARINSLATAMVLLLSMPAGWLAGMLSAHSRALPFVLNLCLLAAQAVVAFFIAKGQSRTNGEANA